MAEMLLERGILVTYEAIRKWCRHSLRPRRERCQRSRRTAIERLVA